MLLQLYIFSLSWVVITWDNPCLLGVWFPGSSSDLVSPLCVNQCIWKCCSLDFIGIYAWLAMAALPLVMLSVEVGYVVISMRLCGPPPIHLPLAIRWDACINTNILNVPEALWQWKCGGNKCCIPTLNHSRDYLLALFDQLQSFKMDPAVYRYTHAGRHLSTLQR